MVGRLNNKNSVKHYENSLKQLKTASTNNLWAYTAGGPKIYTLRFTDCQAKRSSCENVEQIKNEENSAKSTLVSGVLLQSTPVIADTLGTRIWSVIAGCDKKIECICWIYGRRKYLGRLDELIQGDETAKLAYEEN